MKKVKVNGLNWLVWVMIICCDISVQHVWANQSDKNNITIEGYWIRYAGQDTTIVLSYTDEFDPLDPSKQVEAKLHDGQFRFSLQVDHPILASIAVGMSPMFLSSEDPINAHLFEPGDHIKIEIRDHTPLCGLGCAIFSGNGSAKFTMIQQIYKEVHSLTMGQDLVKQIAYLQQIKSIINETVGRSGDQMNKETLNLMKASLYSAYLFKSNIYAKLMKAKWIPTEANLLFNNRFIVDIDLPELLLLGSLFTFPMEDAALLQDRMRSGKEKDDSDTDARYIRVMNNSFKGKLREKILAGYFYRKIKHYGPQPELVRYAKRFVSDSVNEGIYQQRIQNLLDKLSANLNVGSGAFPFSLQDTVGKMVELRDFRGKVLLMDFMFLGCPGCKQMVPYVMDLEKQFKDMPVAFLSVNVDVDRSSWMKAIGVFSSPTSIQVFTNGMGAKHPIVNYYAFNAFPSLVLIDKNGKLITARAPDPRSEEGRKQLVELINKNL